MADNCRPQQHTHTRHFDFLPLPFSGWGLFFLWSAPVAFRRVALETPEWTSRDSNHHQQSVSAGKTNTIPTEPSGRLPVGGWFVP